MQKSLFSRQHRPFGLPVSCNVVASSSRVTSVWCAIVALRVAYVAMQFKPGDKVIAMTEGGNCRNTTGAFLWWHNQYKHAVCLPQHDMYCMQHNCSHNRCTCVPCTGVIPCSIGQPYNQSIYQPSIHPSIEQHTDQSLNHAVTSHEHP